MRTAFIQELIVQARAHPDIFLVVGDLGYSVVEPFVKEFPDRYLNAGVAEQNMTGVAAGLASEGWHVFTYSIANFPTLRCFEQIRNDIAYHNLPVTVVAVGAGMAYGSLGYSHHAVQDIAVMRTLPELTLLSPADPGETRESVQWLAANPRPSYLRLGKAGEANLHDVRGINRGPILVRRGSNTTCAFVATGSILQVALDAASQLAAEGTDVSVFSCPWLEPADAEFFAPLAKFTRLIAISEHFTSGGLASLLREKLTEGVRVSSLEIPSGLSSSVGSQNYLRTHTGIDAAALITLFKRQH